jgi:hypothetical protein
MDSPESKLSHWLPEDGAGCEIRQFMVSENLTPMNGSGVCRVRVDVEVFGVSGNDIFESEMAPCFFATFAIGLLSALREILTISSSLNRGHRATLGSLHAVMDAGATPPVGEE